MHGFLGYVHDTMLDGSAHFFDNENNSHLELDLYQHAR
jgi:hypothetical protein